ncbi:helicase-related protein [Aliidiomarina sp. Khilg15.8]
MSDFAIGQRWLSETEIELGLGLVTAVSGRQVTLLFPASGESRAYAIANAPLTRYQLDVDAISYHCDGWKFTVTGIEHANDIYVYQGLADGTEVEVPETQLHHQVQLSSPLNRLLAGQVDRVNAFNLRQQAQTHLQNWLAHPARGLVGARIELLPHQLYIGHEVASRANPRVLLADEVGLGKTIEAGLIMHSQLLNGQISRVLVQVPDSLLHQWMIELRRRFNLAFSIVDASYCDNAAEQEENPFDQIQLALCPNSLWQRPEVEQQALDAGWDLVVVDEAHQLDDEQRQRVARLSQDKGLLLLTATPDQGGAGTHFSQLQLLDPQRFHYVDAFIEEQAHYQTVAEEAETLEEGSDKLTALLDEHGTGRVLMRNTRHHVRGFPQRQYVRHAVEPNELGDSLEAKVTWLHQLAREHNPDKILVIMHSQAQVEEVAAMLRIKYGRHTALFHEGMSLLERDRAAEFFAEDDGSQLLLSSEIGGEGRNFQFARHLVMLDLPLHPDRLEQRIGRLDRIGQLDAFSIHVPVIEGTEEARLATWYDEALQAFTRPNACGHRLMQLLGDELPDQLHTDEAAFDDFIVRTRDTLEDIRAAMAAGRDRLLELNSCRPQTASELQTAIRASDDDTQLPTFMFAFWDQFGIDVEDKDDKRLILKPGQHFSANGLPGLDDDGSVVTFDRQTALHYDDAQFLTWEHPQVQNALELVLNETHGTTTVALLKNDALPAGHWFLEVIFRASLPQAPTLGLQQQYPTAPLRMLLDKGGRNLSDKIAASTINPQLHFVNKKSAAQMIRALRKPFQQLLKDNWDEAESALQTACNEAGQRMDKQLQSELDRLLSLRERNPSIREDEIETLRSKQAALASAFANPQISVDSVRLIVNAGSGEIA